jgi:pyruvate formate lyase activating enzyme
VAAEIEGFIFDIQRFSLHDGGGIRTLVFMKGCPLRCEWCSNPESQTSKPQLIFYKELCIGCGECLGVCKFGATGKSIWDVDLEKCVGCGACVEKCFSGAKRIVGRQYTVGEVLDIILKDEVFYEVSGGGVTIGGGEPANQPRFVSELLRASREKGIHTAIETCGYARWETFKTILDYTDLLLMDIKHMDPDLHKEKTGVDNALILENAKKACKTVKKMRIRLPFIPGYNDTDENLHALARFAAEELPDVERLDLLPYHSTGASKAARIGAEYPFHEETEQTKQDIERAKKIIRSYGVTVKVGG